MLCLSGFVCNSGHSNSVSQTCVASTLTTEPSAQHAFVCLGESLSQTHHVFKDDAGLLSPLLSPSGCWDCRNAPSCLAIIHYF